MFDYYCICVCNQGFQRSFEESEATWQTDSLWFMTSSIHFGSEGKEPKKQRVEFQSHGIHEYSMSILRTI